ncbi:hypothetical protein [Chitinilyticum piscinae]|uniref:Uncharacterized protein n=1 Tax=Chitinilyticum piscinae TaxID=2866724 RepID=A0A8J7FKD6_9NEIS|nr:hypothetical protein [Chitinilyticum piscinae]MBE9610848.1 hypothetical protein [Chitinilyticum piscinae]
MLGSDWQLARDIAAYWMGQLPPPSSLCPLFVTPEKLVSYLDQIRFRSGHALTPCVGCGEWHRWAFFKRLLERHLIHSTPGDSPILQAIQSKIDQQIASDGGREAYLRSERATDEFFANLPENTSKPKWLRNAGDTGLE